MPSERGRGIRRAHFKVQRVCVSVVEMQIVLRAARAFAARTKSRPAHDLPHNTPLLHNPAPITSFEYFSGSR